MVEETGEGDGGGGDVEASLQLARHPLHRRGSDAFQQLRPSHGHLLLAVLIAVPFLNGSLIEFDRMAEQTFIISSTSG